MKRIIFLTLFLIITITRTPAQEVYQHITHTDIYDFLDELANAQVISINSSVKPYARNLIAQKLFEANAKKGLLNLRQKKELAFYLKDYNKELRSDDNFDKRLDLFFYKDTLFTLSVNPIIGIHAYSNNAGNIYPRWNGAEAFSYIGKNLGFYARFRGNLENKRLADPRYLNQFPAATYEGPGDSESGESSEMHAGLTYSWEWGSVGLIKDHFEWGDNYNGSNIFSGHTPSVPHLRLHMHPVSWLDFNYVHGWLTSAVTDSSESYLNNSGNRLVLYPKYVAANMVTVTPVRHLDVSVGNSVIYSDKNVRPAYLMPFFFYKSTDHSGDGIVSDWQGENHQVFFNISSRQIKNVHLYTSLFVDEIVFGSAIGERTQFSGKAGARFSNFMVHNLFLTAEYTRTNPFAYRHYINTLTFASANYNLGHYLGDNSDEIFLSVMYKPITKFSAEISYSFARKGAEYSYSEQAGTVAVGSSPFMQNVKWQASGFGIKTQYQVINDCYVLAGFMVSDNRGSDAGIYTPTYFSGKRTTINIGANIGF